nr:hypothetical protein BgiMline_023208 [Biomphalaria glabrata]
MQWKISERSAEFTCHVLVKPIPCLHNVPIKILPRPHWPSPKDPVTYRQDPVAYRQDPVTFLKSSYQDPIMPMSRPCQFHYTSLSRPRHLPAKTLSHFVKTLSRPHHVYVKKTIKDSVTYLSTPCQDFTISM